MITYIQDLDKTHDAAIKNMLRSHNSQFSDIDSGSSNYLYAFREGVLAGAMEVSFFWDWVAIGNLFYEDTDVLAHLARAAWERYRDQAVGMYKFTTEKDLASDLAQAGFTEHAAVPVSKHDTYHYMNYGPDPSMPGKTCDVSVRDEPVAKHQAVLASHTDAFNKAHGLISEAEVLDVAALEGDRCVGGIQTEIYGDMLYVSRIAVDPAYRKRRIGSELMLRVIKHARERKLSYVMLGTTEFHARSFYEKLGFRALYERPDNPRGYTSFMMSMRLT